MGINFKESGDTIVAEKDGSGNWVVWNEAVGSLTDPLLKINENTGAVTWMNPKLQQNLDANGYAINNLSSASDLAVVYNVKNYGAKGDGSTDDTTAIQNCIDDAGAGNIVYFPSTPGSSYKHTGLKLNHTCQSWIGQSKSMTELKNAGTGPSIEVDHLYARQWKVRDLVINGDNNGTYGIYVHDLSQDAKGWTVKNVYFANHTNYALYSPGELDIFSAIFENIRIYGNPGFYALFGPSVTLKSVYSRNVGTGNFGLEIPLGQNLEIKNYNCSGTGGGIKLGDAQNAVKPFLIQSSNFEGLEESAIEIYNKTYGQMENIRILNCGDEPSGYYGIYVDDIQGRIYVKSPRITITSDADKSQVEVNSGSGDGELILSKDLGPRIKDTANRVQIEKSPESIESISRQDLVFAHSFANESVTGSGILDSSQFNNLITNNGATIGLGEGYNNSGGINFNGSSDYATIADDSSMQFGTNDFTIFLIVKCPPTNGSRDYILNKSATSRYALDFYSGLELRLTDDSGNSLNVQRGSGYTDGEWRIFTVTVDRTNDVVKMYAGGNQVGTDEDISSITGNISPSATMYLGAASAGAGFANISISSLFIWERLLSRREIKTLNERVEEISSPYLLKNPNSYSPSNVSTDRTFDANSTTVEELADVVGTLLDDLNMT